MPATMASYAAGREIISERLAMRAHTAVTHQLPVNTRSVQARPLPEAGMNRPRPAG